MIDKLKIKHSGLDSKGVLQTSDVEIEVKKFNILVGDIGGIEVEDPRVATITAQDTVAFAKAIPQGEWVMLAQHPKFTELYSMVFDNIPPQVITTAPIDIQHVVGLLILVAKAVSEGKTPLIKLPETYLHPRNVAGLTSALFQMCGEKK